MTELDEEDTAKALGQFLLTLNGLLRPLRLYGQGDYVDEVTREIEKLAWQLHWRLEGIDEPYEIEVPHW